MSSPDLKLFLNDKIFEGWKTFNVSKKINSLVETFNATVTNKWGYTQEPIEIREGDAVKASIGEESLFSGFVEDVNLTLDSKNRSIILGGRSRTADLVDCSYTGPMEYPLITFKDLMNTITKPFGLTPIFLTTTSSDKIKATVTQGETVGSIIDRFVRENSLIVYVNKDGNPIFNTNTKKNSGAKIFENGNMLSGRVNRKSKNRFSDYITKAQTNKLVGGATELTENVFESVKDSEVKRYRPFVIIADNSPKAPKAKTRAIYEKDKRISMASTFKVDVTGYCKQDGKLWALNELVELKSDSLDFEGLLLVESINFVKSNSGSITQLELVNQDAYDFKDKAKAKTQKPMVV